MRPFFVCRLIFGLVLLCIASRAMAQVQLDTTTYTTPGNSATCEMTLTVGANPNRALIVGAHSASATVVGVAGAGATWGVAVARTSSRNHVEIWVGTNPTAGAQTVTVTYSASDADVVCGADSFYGVDQAAPTTNANGSTGSAGTAQAAITTNPANVTFAAISHDDYFDPPSGCTSSTDWFTTQNLQYAQSAHCAGAPSATLSWTTWSAWSLVTVDVQAAGGGGGSGPPWTGIVAASRAIDWRSTNPGVQGGIPNRTTICATLNPGATAAQINSAIASCASGQVVKLQAGTYNLSTGIVFDNKSNVTLRGAGPNQTFLVFSAGDPCGGLGGDLCIRNGDTNFSGAPSNVANWTSGYTPGTTSITLGANTLGSVKPSVGTLLTLDQLDDSDVDNGAVWVCQRQNVCSLSNGVSQGRPGRGQTQVVRVTAISAGACPCTITISPGLYMPNWRASQSPAAWWSNSLPVTASGVEDLSMDHTASSARAGTFIYNGDGIWVKNVRSLNVHEKHVWMYQSVHTTVRDSYFYGTQNAASDSYGTDTYTGGDQLIENNIFQHIATPMVNEGAEGTVHAYNFAIDDFYTSGGTAPQWQEASSFQHAVGNNFLLWEGNIGIGLTADDIHGTSGFITAFRNYWNGRDPAGGSSGGKTQQTNAVILQSFNRYYNLVGNVLGTSTYHLTYESAASTTADDASSDSNRSVYTLGYAGNEGQHSPLLLNDPLAKRTLLRWGNYDTVTATQWQANEVPFDLSLYANPVPANHTLPASFYLSAKPSWWGTAVWPGIGPDISNGNITDPGGHANKIPAQRCYESLADDPDHPNVKIFNAGLATCYP